MFSCRGCNGFQTDTYKQWIVHLHSKDHQLSVAETVWSWPKEVNGRSIVVTGKPNLFGELVGQLPANLFDIPWYFSDFGVVTNAFYHPNQKYCIIQLEKRQYAMNMLETATSCTISNVPVVLQLKDDLSPQDLFRLRSFSKTQDVQKIKISVFDKKHKWLSDQTRNLNFDVQLERFMTSLTMSQSDFQKREQVRIDFLSIIREEFKNVKVIATGDVLTGLGDSDSILNLNLELNDSRFTKEIIEGIHRIMISAKRLCKNVSQAIPNEAIPYITAIHCATNVKMQLSFNNFISVRSSRLIQFMISLDSRVLPLMLVIRYWASYNIQPPNSINSYILELLVLVFLNSRNILPNVAFLQSKNTVVMPLFNNLWNVSFCSDHQSITEVLSKSGRTPVEYSDVTGKPTTNSILLLAKNFFQMYADVDFGRTAVCSLLGNFVSKTDLDVDNKDARLPQFLQPYKSWSLLQNREDRMMIDSAMCVQHPFELSRNVAANVTKSSLVAFQNACRNSIESLEQVEKKAGRFDCKNSFLEFFTRKEDNTANMKNIMHVENNQTAKKPVQAGQKRGPQPLFPPSSTTFKAVSNSEISGNNFRGPRPQSFSSSPTKANMNARVKNVGSNNSSNNSGYSSSNSGYSSNNYPQPLLPPSSTTFKAVSNSKISGNNFPGPRPQSFSSSPTKANVNSGVKNVGSNNSSSNSGYSSNIYGCSSDDYGYSSNQYGYCADNYDNSSNNYPGSHIEPPKKIQKSIGRIPSEEESKVCFSESRGFLWKSLPSQKSSSSCDNQSQPQKAVAGFSGSLLRPSYQNQKNIDTKCVRRNFDNRSYNSNYGGPTMKPETNYGQGYKTGKKTPGRKGMSNPTKQNWRK